MPLPPNLRFLLLSSCLLLAVTWSPRRANGQEPPYFVTYSHHLEEPGNLEVELNPVFTTQRNGNNFLAATTEFEYGVKAWWTSEFYIDAQSTFGDSSVFTGYRWENRIRPLMHEHWINPLLYFEYENLNGADKAMIEVVGFDSEADHASPNSTLRRTHDHELEGKLILSSDIKGWNISENFIAERNLGHDPYEFGYAIGASRPLALQASARSCRFCAENLLVGAEFYGGLGTTWNVTMSGTSHYAAPILAWQLPNGASFHVSPGFGLDNTSHRFVLRWGISYEIPAFGSRLRRLLQ